MVVQPMPGVKVRYTDNNTIYKIIRKSHMKCCGIFYSGVKLTSWYCKRNFLHGTTAGLNIRKFLQMNIELSSNQK